MKTLEMRLYLSFMVILGIVSMFWLVDRQEPLVHHGRRVLTPIVQAGGPLKVKWAIERRRQCATLVEQILFDGEGVRIRLPEQRFLHPGPLGADQYVTAVTVPEIASPGPAKMRTTLLFQCNPSQAIFPIVQSVEDLSFTILPSTTGDRSP